MLLTKLGHPVSWRRNRSVLSCWKPRAGWRLAKTDWSKHDKKLCLNSRMLKFCWHLKIPSCFCVIILIWPSRSTCTQTLQSLVTWCSQDWTRRPQRSWHWTCLRFREQRSTQPHSTWMKKVDIRVSYFLYQHLSHYSLHHQERGGWVVPVFTKSIFKARGDSNGPK